jgi:hypothetical protein
MVAVFSRLFIQIFIKRENVMDTFERLATKLPRCGQAQKLGWHFRLMPKILVLLVLFQVGSPGMSHAEVPQSAPKAPLDRVWPFSLSSKRPLSNQDQKYAEAAFIQWLEAYLRREYEVIDRRIFWGKGKSAVWVAIGKGHALYPDNENGQWRVLEEIEQDWSSPGIDLVRIWKVSIDGKTHYLAIAMTNEPVPGTRGHHLIGRFELKKLLE